MHIFEFEMDYVHLPELTINIDTQQNDIKSLLKILKPKWKPESINIKSLSGGFSGRLFHCYEENYPVDGLTVRLRGYSEIAKIWTNENEIKMIEYLSKHGHFPKLYAIFANGYCYQYIEGRPMFLAVKGEEGYVDDHMLSLIGKELAYIHSVKLQGLDYTKSSFFTVWEKILSESNIIKPFDFTPSKVTILSEMRFLKDYLSKKNSRLVTCHGDPHAGNIVWNSKTETLTFVDWEGVLVGHQYQDIAMFLMSTTLMEPYFSNKPVEELFPRNHERKFLRSYLEEWYRLNNDNRNVTEEEIESLLKESEVYVLPILLFLIGLTLCLPKKIEEFSGDNKRFVERLIHEYFSVKARNIGKGLFENE